MKAATDSGRKILSTGLLFAVSAYFLWGFVPPYWKLLAHVPGLQVAAHRILWTCLLLGALVTLRRGWGAVRAAFADRRSALTLLASSALVTVNWTLFVWAVLTNRIVESSMGYFINPLVSVALGVLVLREPLRAWQAVAVALAMAGGTVYGVGLGGLPWISVVLAVSFGLYGLLRKRLPVDAVTGTFIEALYALPLALLYLGREAALGRGAFGSADGLTHLLLVLAGPVTAVPLVWFAAGARRIPLSMIGFLQYLTPTMHLALGVLLYREPFTRTHLIGFGLIWAGSGLYLASSLLGRRRSSGRGARR